MVAPLPTPSKRLANIDEFTTVQQLRVGGVQRRLLERFGGVALSTVGRTTGITIV